MSLMKRWCKFELSITVSWSLMVNLLMVDTLMSFFFRI